MDNLKKMKFLLLLPITGSIILMTYLKFKSHKITYIKLKHWILIGFLIGIIFWLVMISVFALISTIITHYTVMNDSLSIVAHVVSFIVAGYLANIPCLIYVNSILKISKNENLNNNSLS